MFSCSSIFSKSADSGRSLKSSFKVPQLSSSFSWSARVSGPSRPVFPCGCTGKPFPRATKEKSHSRGSSSRHVKVPGSSPPCQPDAPVPACRQTTTGMVQPVMHDSVLTMWEFSFSEGKLCGLLVLPSTSYQAALLVLGQTLCVLSCHEHHHGDALLCCRPKAGHTFLRVVVCNSGWQNRFKIM